MGLAHDTYVAFQQRRNAAPVTLIPARTALLVIDMQEYFLHPQSPFSRACEAQAPGILAYLQERAREVVVPALQRLLACCRARDVRVIYTTVASELDDGGDLMPIFQQRNAAARALHGQPFIPPRHDPWARIVPALAPQPEDLVLNKTTYSAFTATGLDATLRHLGLTTLLVGGVVTNVCVETTARDAADRGYEVVLVDDACAAYSPEIHAATLLSFQGTFGRVRTAAQVVAQLSEAAAAVPA